MQRENMDGIQKQEQVKLPSNVTRTRSGGAVQRYGVKIRFHNLSIRIGSAYANPHDAGIVASIFKKIAYIDEKNGNMCFSKNFEKKYKGIYVNRYLPFTSTMDTVEVVQFLSNWLKEWNSKRVDNNNNKRNGLKKKSNINKASSSSFVKEASNGDLKTYDNNNNNSDSNDNSNKEIDYDDFAGRQTKKRKRKKKHDDYIASSFNFSSTDNNKNKSKEEGKKKETNRGPHFIDSKLKEIITSENIANNILCIPSNFEPLFDIVINNNDDDDDDDENINNKKENSSNSSSLLYNKYDLSNFNVNDLMKVIHNFITPTGEFQYNNSKYTELQNVEKGCKWRSHTHEIICLVRSLINDKSSCPSSSTEAGEDADDEEEEEEEEEKEGTRVYSTVSSRYNNNDDDDNNYNDSFNYNSSSISVPFDVTMTTTMSIEGKENEIFYDGLSDMYIESITPNIIEKNDLKFENLLISIKGIWDSDSISHGVLERIDLDDGLLLPNTKKIVDILHLNERSGTSAYFAIDLKEFSVGRYKFKLIANDDFNSQIGESNYLDFVILKKEKTDSKQQSRQNSFDHHRNNNSNNNNHNNNNNNNNNNTGNYNNQSENTDGFNYTSSSSNSSSRSRRHHRNNKHDNNNGNSVQYGYSINVLDINTEKELINNGWYHPILAKFNNLFSHLGYQQSAVFIVALAVFTAIGGSLTLLAIDERNPLVSVGTRYVEKFGITDISIKLCSYFENERLCKDKFTYLSNMLSHASNNAPGNYFSTIREPLPYALEFEHCIYSWMLFFLCATANFSAYDNPYKRDRVNCFLFYISILLEMFSWYLRGYAATFSIPLITIGVLVYITEFYIQQNWSIETYAKYRLEYKATHTFLLELCRFSMYPWLLKNYGTHNSKAMPFLSALMFTPVSLRTMCRGYVYYLLVNTKKPFSYVLSWLPRIVVASIIVSILSAYINDSFNIFTITQLMPYILAPHLIAFSCAMLLSYFNVTHYIAEKAVLEDKKLPGWHM